MATVSITVHVLGGAELVIVQDPGELVESLRLKVEDRIGCLGEFQEVKLLTEAEELCCDAIVAECLRPESIVQAVVTMNVRKAKEFIQNHKLFTESPRFPANSLPPPPIYGYPPELWSFRQSPLPGPEASMHPRPLAFANAFDVLAKMEQSEEIRNLTDRFSKLDSRVWSHHDLPLLIRLWFLSGCPQNLQEAIKFELGGLFAFKSQLVDDEGTNWIKLAASLEADGTESSVRALCCLASSHILPEVRAAAISALGSAPVWLVRAGLLSQLQIIADTVRGDPTEMVREAAAAAVGALQSRAPTAPPVVRPAPAQVMPPPAQHNVQQPTQPPATAAGRAIAKAPAVVNASLPVRPSFGEAETEPDLLEALEQSENEALQQELQHVQEALLRSKQDMSVETATLFRLTFHNPQVISFILNFPALAECRSRVESAGCSVQPAWANGGLILVPATEEQVGEAGIVLRAHNISMLDCDKVLLEECLAQLSRRKRPQLKLEHYPGGTQANPKTEPISYAGSEHGFDAGREANFSPRDWMQDAGLVVERTFLSFPVEREISDASTIVHSAPAVPQMTSGSLNPHQWRLPLLKNAGDAPATRISRKPPESV